MNQLLQVRRPLVEDFRHVIGPLLRGRARIIEVLSNLVLKKPRQLAVNENLIRIIAQAVVTEQFDASLHPAPAVGKRPGADSLNLTEML